MLLQFSVKNFRSIKDRVVLSLEASGKKEHSNNYAEIEKESLLKSAAIFGANASGKSNIFLALTAAILLIRKSNERQIGEPLSLIVPFRFDKHTSAQPTEFEFVFWAEGKKYVYGFSATVKQIVTEYLYVFNSSKASTIFERDENGIEDEQGNRSNEKYKFTIPTLRTKLKPLVERNTANKLFLATATAWNFEETRVPMLWFMHSINTYAPNQYVNLLPITGDLFEHDDDQSLRAFVKGVLKEADINISDYEFESKDIPVEQFAPVQIPVRVGTRPEVKGKEYRITALHTITDDTGNTQVYPLEMQSESLGTKNLFFLSPIIKRAFETGETVCVDEFDTSLHPMLVVYLLGLFHNPNVNKKNAQLIISSHTMSLLDLKTLRRDQIYFVDKDQSSGVTELYSLDDFSPRTSENIRKAYLIGRYGAIPVIKNSEAL